MLSFQGVGKAFGTRIALEDLRFTVKAGRRVGLLGRNGAGKTTLLRLAAGVLEPTWGELRLADACWGRGEDGRLGRLLGYLPEKPPLYEEMTVVDYLEFCSRFRGFDAVEASRQARRQAPRCGLSDVLHRRCGVLSKGYRQRVGLAQALLHDPRILLLDEPTAGLDPEQVEETRSILSGLPEETTLIISSHILSDVAAVCDEIMILDEGRLLAHDRTEVLARKVEGSQRLRLRVRGEEEAIRAFLESQDLAGAVLRLLDGEQWQLQVELAGGEEAVEQLARAIVEAGFGLRGLERFSLDLAEIFRVHTGGRGRGGDVPADREPSPRGLGTGAPGDQ